LVVSFAYRYKKYTLNALSIFDEHPYIIY